jgi:hypothetical protein
MDSSPRAGLFANLFGRLRFPQLFGTLLVLFLVDLAIPDLIPFADELLLGGLTALVGLLKRSPAATAGAAPSSASGATAKPPIKDVTPRP